VTKLQTKQLATALETLIMALAIAAAANKIVAILLAKRAE
jgi:hypothetical protein